MNSTTLTAIAAPKIRAQKIVLTNEILTQAAPQVPGGADTPPSDQTGYTLARRILRG